MNKRYHNIDLIKSIGIFLVLLYHFNTIELNFIADRTIIIFVNYTFRSICSMCVPLFFFANGFLLIRKELNMKKHISRMIQMLILTVIWGVVDLAFIVVIKGERLSLYQFVEELWICKHGWTSHLWFMGALVCVHIFLPLIKTSFDHNRRVYNYFVAVCCILVFGNEMISMFLRVGYYFFLNGTDYAIKNVFNMFNPIVEINSPAFGYFCVGCLFGGYDEKINAFIRNRISNWLICIIIVVDTLLLSVWGIFCSYTSGSIWDNIWYGYDLIFTLINVIAVYALSINYKGTYGIHKYIKAISSNTFGIYFIHVIVNNTFVMLGIKELPCVNNIFFNMLIVFVILNISLVISVLLRKLPVLKHLVR